MVNSGDNVIHQSKNAAVAATDPDDKRSSVAYWSAPLAFPLWTSYDIFICGKTTHSPATDPDTIRVPDTGNGDFQRALVNFLNFLERFTTWIGGIYFLFFLLRIFISPYFLF